MTHPPLNKIMEQKTVKRIRDTVRKHSMLERGDTVIVAVSGGVDSMVLLHALNRMRKDLDLSLVVCHLNHAIRGKESDRDYRFVKKACRDLRLEFEGRKLKAGELNRADGSTQEAARIKRYEYLEEVAKKRSADKIALGHTLDDQAETVLMRFIKGSSIKGLAGIPPVRGHFIRPLIDLEKAELKRFAEEEGIRHVEDSSNMTPKYLRNDLRLNLIPVIKKYNPNLIETLARTASLLGDDEECLDNLSRGLMSRAIIKNEQSHLTLDRLILTKLHRALAARVFLNAIEHLNGRSNAYSVHVRSFLNIVNGRSVSSSLNLPGGLSARREYDRVIISSVPAKEIKPFNKTVKVPGITRLEGNQLLKSAIITRRPWTFHNDGNIAYFDYTAIKGPINVRSIKPGDRMTPFGMKESKKLKEILIEKKIPRALRGEIPLLCSGEDVLWAVSVRQSEHFRIGRNTKKILKIEYIKNN